MYAVANVLKQIFEETKSAGVSTFFLDLFQPTKVEVSGTARFPLRHSAIDVPLRGAFEIELQLLVQLALGLLTPKESSGPGPRLIKPRLRQHSLGFLQLNHLQNCTR